MVSSVRCSEVICNPSIVPAGSFPSFYLTTCSRGTISLSSFSMRAMSSSLNEEKKRPINPRVGLPGVLIEIKEPRWRSILGS